MESYAEGSVEVVTDMKNVYDMNIGFYRWRIMIRSIVIKYIKK